MSDTPDPPAPAAPAPPGRRLKWLFVGSLAVNLLLIGAMAGPHLFGHRPWRGGDRPGEEFGLMGYSRHLPKERRKMIRAIIETERDSLKALREDVRKARIEAGGVLAAEPFDADKLKSAVGRIGEAEAKLKSAGLAIFLNAAQQMTAEERQGLLEHWKRRRPSLFRSHGDGRGEGPPTPKD